MSQITTLKYLSSVSGFSISTISKALNNKEDVSNNTKYQIQKLAKSLNYIGNSSAIALRTKKTNMIAVIVPKINSGFYSNILSAIQECAFVNNYRIMIMQSFICKNKELECFIDVNDGSVDGIIILKPNNNLDHSRSLFKIYQKNYSPHFEMLKIDNLNLNEFKSKELGFKCFNSILNKINESKKTSISTN